MMLEIKKKKRFIVFIIIMGIMVIILIAYLGYLMIILPAGEDDDIIKFPLIERGPILDRNGRILAIQTKLNSISAWIPHVEKIDETATLLAEILSVEKDRIIKQLQESNNFVYIKREITPAESKQIEELKQEGKLKGISLIPEYARNYPEQELASHIIGYVGVDNIGLGGIEYIYDRELSPRDMGTDINTVYGNQIFLTIDINIQYMLEKIAARAFEENLADSVMILVMQAKTGEILGSVSLPNFNPNELSKTNQENLVNRVISNAYEPGSVFKIFTFASLLDTGTITVDDHFYCNGKYEKEIENQDPIIINCLGVHGSVNAQMILKYSCNAGAAYASDSIDKVTFYNKLQEFGFGKQTGIPLPGETYGLLRNPRQWSLRSKPTIAMGQEILVSALQMVTATTVFANQGVLLKPQIIKKIVSPSGQLIKEYSREPAREVISSTVALQILEMMQTATDFGGTAQASQIKGLDIAAKTGTAQIWDSESKKYSDKNYTASILGLLPTGDPQLIIYVVIPNHNPKKYFGSQIAAPVFKEIAEELIGYLNIHKEGDTIIIHTGEVKIIKPETIKLGNTVPDFTNIPKRLLLPLLEIPDIDIIIRGEGYVYSQEPQAGTTIKKGMTIILKLR